MDGLSALVQRKAAVFIDRDGTLIEDRHHLASVEQIRVFSNSFEAVRRVNASGRLAVVITNQSVIARGLLTEPELSEIHSVMVELFAQEDAVLDAIYYCPHHPKEGSGSFTRKCDCRKPNPGMLIRASDDLGIDLGRSVLIGDTLSDIEAGNRGGARTVLVMTGYGSECAARISSNPDSVSTEQIPDYVAPDVLEAVEWSLNQDIP